MERERAGRESKALEGKDTAKEEGGIMGKKGEREGAGGRGELPIK